MKFTTLIVGGIIILTALVVFIILLIFLYQKRYYRHLREKEELRAQLQQESLQAQLEIQEQTLKNIAQEIHDNIGQELSLAKLNLNTMDVSNPTELEHKIDASKNLVGKAIQDLRDLSRGMNMDMIADMGLYRAIGHELEVIEKTGGYKTRFDVQDELPRLEPQKELIIFRIVQESLHNIIKHAGASSILVTVKNADGTMELCISDNGKGFDPAAVEEMKGAGMGLRNMPNRARLINAGFSLESKPGKGTEIRLTLPMNQ